MSLEYWLFKVFSLKQGYQCTVLFLNTKFLNQAPQLSYIYFNLYLTYRLSYWL